jgi:hypothetical protein
MPPGPSHYRCPAQRRSSPLIGLTRLLVAFALIAGVSTFVTPPPAGAQSGGWADIAEASGPEQDGYIAELLTTLPLTDALTVARSLPRREHADIGAPLRALYRGPRAATQRAELLTRVALDALHALPADRRRPALEANAGLLRHFLVESSRLESAMLRAAVWRAAAASSEEARRDMLPAARTAAAALHARFAAAGDDRVVERAPDRREDPELTAEGLAFFSYADVTPDSTLVALADAIREESRDAALVERARSVLESR